MDPDKNYGVGRGNPKGGAAHTLARENPKGRFAYALARGTLRIKGWLAITLKVGPRILSRLGGLGLLGEPRSTINQAGGEGKIQLPTKCQKLKRF